MTEAKDDERYLFLFALRTFRRLLGSFALPLLLPLLVSSAVYTAAISSIERETSRTNESVLLLMKRIVDAQLNQLSVAADQLSLNEEVQNIAIAAPPLAPSRRLTMSAVQNLLRQCALANESIEGIYLYLPRSGYVLSNVSRYAEDEFDYIARDKFGMSSSDWKKNFASSPYRSFRLLVPDDPSKPASFAFSQRMVFPYSGAEPSVLVIKTDGRRFLDLLDSFKWNEDASLAVLSESAAIAARPGLPHLADPLRYADLPKEYRSEKVSAAKGSHHVSTIGSDVSSWRYAYIVPSATYSRSADFVKIVMTLYVLVCLSGGFLLSMHLARREYTPVRRLSRIFLDRLGAAGKGDEGGFPYLEGALRGLLREHENLEELIRRQNGTVRNGLLARLLAGGAVQFDNLLDSCRACGIVFPSDFCMVVGVAVCSGGEPLSGESTPSEIDTGALVRYMLQPLLDELLEKGSSGYVIQTPGGIRCLVCLAPERNPAAFVSEMKATTEQIRGLFVERFGISLSFALSRVYESFSALPLAGAEIDELVESIVLYDRRDVTLCAEDFGDGPDYETGMRSSLALYRAVAENVIVGDFAAAREGVFRFLDAEILDSELPLQAAKLRISGIVNIVVEALQEMKPSIDAESIDELKPIDRLSRVKSISELKRQVEDIFLALESRWAARTPDSSPGLKDEVVKFVESNFRDLNLNVNSIAESFGVSVPHLSRTFKKTTGIGLLDYIHIVRIREAKLLMRENKLGVGEIAVMVGCGSRVTLARAFKRYEGIAPSVFRDSAPGR